MLLLLLLFFVSFYSLLSTLSLSVSVPLSLSPSYNLQINQQQQQQSKRYRENKSQTCTAHGLYGNIRDKKASAVFMFVTFIYSRSLVVFQLTVVLF